MWPSIRLLCHGGILVRSAPAEPLVRAFLVRVYMRRGDLFLRVCPLVMPALGVFAASSDFDDEQEGGEQKYCR